jgi:hypothetical protein
MNVIVRRWNNTLSALPENRLNGLVGGHDVTSDLDHCRDIPPGADRRNIRLIGAWQIAKRLVPGREMTGEGRALVGWRALQRGWAWLRARLGVRAGRLFTPQAYAASFISRIRSNAPRNSRFGAMHMVL